MALRQTMKQQKSLQTTTHIVRSTVQSGGGMTAKQLHSQPRRRRRRRPICTTIAVPIFALAFLKVRTWQRSASNNALAVTALPLRSIRAVQRTHTYRIQSRHVVSIRTKGSARTVHPRSTSTSVLRQHIGDNAFDHSSTDSSRSYRIRTSSSEPYRLGLHSTSGEQRSTQPGETASHDEPAPDKELSELGHVSTKNDSHVPYNATLSSHDKSAESSDKMMEDRQANKRKSTQPNHYLSKFERLKQQQNAQSPSTPPPQQQQQTTRGAAAPEARQTSTASEASSSSSWNPLSGKQSTDYVTVADVQALLLERDGNDLARRGRRARSERELEYDSTTTITTTTGVRDHRRTQSSNGRMAASPSLRSSGGVAFPQPSLLSYQDVTYGATVASSLYSMLLAMSVVPNLWLIGGLVGGLYGYELGRDEATFHSGGPGDKDSNNDNNKRGRNSRSPVALPKRSSVGRLVLASGRRLAKVYLLVRDTVSTVFFLYKTGQLSYSYWKKYAKLDDSFAITQKIDAWNSRFVQGKVAFDAWEREHEIAKKTLAALRTVWLVEEQSLKRTAQQRQLRRGRQSRYRVVQFVYDTLDRIRWTARTAYRRILKSDYNGEGGWRELLRGAVRMSSSLSQGPWHRIRGSVASLATVAIVASLFTIGPRFMLVIAFVAGGIWPDWGNEVFNRTLDWFDQARAEGKTEVNTALSEKSTTLDRLPIQTLLRAQRFKSTAVKKRYNFYRSVEGKKRYYRVGPRPRQIRPPRVVQSQPVQRWGWPWQA